MNFKNLINYIYPQRCPICDEAVSPFGALICDKHKDSFSFVAGPTCLKCGKEIGDVSSELCYDCRQSRRGFARNVAIINYDNAAQEAMVRFKYKGRREYADYFAKELVRHHEMTLRGWNLQLVLPVPIHESRLKSRGYNQAGELAKRIAKLLGLPYREDILVRCKKTEAQKELSAASREANIAEALGITARLPGICRVLIVDDIYTTGSTLAACTKVLLEAGVKEVFCATICIGRDS